jgi:hypothetical protein
MQRYLVLVLCCWDAGRPLGLQTQDKVWEEGYGGVGDYANSHGNTAEATSVAHEVRNSATYDSWRLSAKPTSRPPDCVNFQCSVLLSGISYQVTGRYGLVGFAIHQLS